LEINGVHNIQQGKPSSSERVKTGDECKQIFDQKLAEVTLAEPKNSRAHIIGQGDKILGPVDDYTQQLIDPARMPKDIEPLVERVKREVGVIEDEVLTQFPHEKDLERLSKGLVVAANVAVFKFQRANYI
jgi:hypothetical protein